MSLIAKVRILVALTLIMAAGWGIRGAFGHSRGAAMPGAMLGLSVALFSTRDDWWKRVATLGFLGAIGWAFAGTASYGLLIGYSQGGSWLNSAYGYSGLFLVGGLYGGIGAAVLSVGLTESRSTIDKFLWPMILIYGTWLLLEWLGWKAWSLKLVEKSADRPMETQWLFDTLWLDAASAFFLSACLWIAVPKWREATSLIALLSLAWFLGMFVLVGATGFRINPSRGDAWAGCVGMLIAWSFLFWRQTNRAAILLTGYGVLSGGLGFVVGEFIQALGKAKWGPIGTYPVLQEFGYWTIMEQTLGAMMGLGIALGIIRLLKGNLTAPADDASSSWFDSFALFVLLGAIFAFNFKTNYRSWIETKILKDETLSLPSEMLLISTAVAILGLLAFAIIQQKRRVINIAPATALGRVQLVTILYMWMVMAIYMLLPRIGFPTSLMFFGELIMGTLLVLCVADKPVTRTNLPDRDKASSHWKLGRIFYSLCGLVPFAIALIAWFTVQFELQGKIRF